jgi:hypothetical protein
MEARASMVVGVYVWPAAPTNANHGALVHVCFRFGLFACCFVCWVLSIVLTPKSGEDFSHVAADQHIVDAVDELRAATAAAALVHKKLFGFSPLPMCRNAASVSLPFSSFRLRCRTSRSHPLECSSTCDRDPGDGSGSGWCISVSFF